MARSKTLLALDLATTTGWAEGPVDGDPSSIRFGHIRLAPEGSCMGAVFAGLIQFVGSRLLAFRPDIIAFEAPIDPRIMGMKTSKDMIRRAIGLAGVVEGVAYKMGVYDVYEAQTGDLKQFWHGRRAIKREEVKRLTIAKMRSLGYQPATDDEADAISIHRYVASTLGHKSEASAPALSVEAVFKAPRVRRSQAAQDFEDLEIPL